MARERFLKSDLDDGLGVEGKRPHDAKASVDESSADLPGAKDQSAPEERDKYTKVKKGKSFDRLSIKEKDDANIFR